MTRYAIRICNFSETEDIKRPTYKKVKQRILQAGRFSVFEAMAGDKMARIFERIEKDPELETDRVNFKFPWIGVRRKK